MATPPTAEVYRHERLEGIRPAARRTPRPPGRLRLSDAIADLELEITLPQRPLDRQDLVDVTQRQDRSFSVGNWIALAKGTLPSFSWKMPVNQSFTCEAGSKIWGFPKTVERIEFDYSREDSFHALLEMDGEKVFEMRVPRGRGQSPPAMELTAYSYIDGKPHETRFTQRSEGVGMHFGGRAVELRLGDHPIARTLRGLGLPKKPLMTVWTERRWS
jgi:hypothetical protein